MRHKKDMDISPEHKKYRRNLKKRKLIIHLMQAVILIGFFALWELAAQLNWIDPFIVSSPGRAFKVMAGMFADGSIYEHIGVTMLETVIGFVTGTVLGVIIAILLWWSEMAQKIFDPYLVVLNSLPKIALGPVIIVWVGAGMGAIITVTLLISLVVTVIGVLNGFTEVDKEKIMLLKTFGGNKRQIFAKVVFPASIPTTISILKINVGMSWVGVIVGEFLVSKAGLGYLIVYGGQVFKLDLVMGGVLVLCVLAALMYYLVAILEKIITKRLSE